MVRASDPFDRAAAAAPPPLPTRYVSTTSVAIGEGLQFSVGTLELVDAKDDEDSDDGKPQVWEITGRVIESRARRFVDGQELVVTCNAIRLDQIAEELVKWRAEHTGLVTVVTLIRGPDEGKTAGWRRAIEAREEEPDGPAA